MRLPRDDESMVILGHNGSGKTHEAMYQLSQRSFDVMPWIVLDAKGDDLVAQLPITEQLTVTDNPPDIPGLYVVRVRLEDFDEGRVARFMNQCLEHRNVGMLADEGQYFGHRNRGLHNYLTQGRSANCPLICLSQRPLNIDTYLFSESAFIQTFYLPHPDDKERVTQYIPSDQLDFTELQSHGKHYSYIYCVRDNSLELLEPAPKWSEIYGRILTRLPVIEDEPLAPDAPPIPRRVRL